MSDYDFKNIPILDDIIESDEVDSATLNAEDDIAEGSETNDENLDFFANENADGGTSCLIDTTDSEADMSEVDIIDQAIIEDSVIEIDTGIDIEANGSSMLDSTQADTDILDDNIPTQESIVESTPIETEDTSNTLPQHTTPLVAASLESIVEDVVKQLMPDLEQQLRYLVEQALEDKLPAEIIEKLSSKPE